MLPTVVIVSIWAKNAFCVPFSVLWIGQAVETGKFVELVAPVTTASPSAVFDAFNTAIASPLSFPLPPRYEKYMERLRHSELHVLLKAGLLIRAT